LNVADVVYAPTATLHTN